MVCDGLLDYRLKGLRISDSVDISYIFLHFKVKLIYALVIVVLVSEYAVEQIDARDAVCWNRKALVNQIYALE